MATPFAADVGAVANTAADETVREVDALLQKLQVSTTSTVRSAVFVRVAEQHKQTPRYVQHASQRPQGDHTYSCYPTPVAATASCSMRCVIAACYPCMSA
jgi:hypothetical protein